MNEDQITVKLQGQAVATWTPKIEGETEFGNAAWLRLALTSGTRRREALTTSEVVEDRERRRTVIAHVACWENDVPDIPAVAAYVWGHMTLEDGEEVEGLAMLVMDLDGMVRHIEPLPELEEV